MKIVVAPLAGARIEISDARLRTPASGVAPLAGARIEIDFAYQEADHVQVAPLAGARIEILYLTIATQLG